MTTRSNTELPMQIPATMRKSDAVADLKKGTFERLSVAAWNASKCCEDIPKEQAAKGWDAIRFARAQLDLAEQHLVILRELEAKP